MAILPTDPPPAVDEPPPADVPPADVPPTEPDKQPDPQPTPLTKEQKIQLDMAMKVSGMDSQQREKFIVEVYDILNITDPVRE